MAPKTQPEPDPILSPELMGKHSIHSWMQSLNRCAKNEPLL